MQFDDLRKSGQLKKEFTSKAKIAEFLQFAEEEISAAKFNFASLLINQRTMLSSMLEMRL